ncbi:FAD-dependent oxidoreductase [Hoeflea sp. G2-23]|uniref:FAD-dependent oxidoreductase n=1 Tax=Hoeflea algicola TaxID=2983763 RepID=A0ABT3ZBU5_9HYPH|nr:FAD-dependent oxidoreductase [Hoeflea algicola]MCY0149270.1 FAD-dependent oxidoreductase [Hoeflea algicola]
MFEKLFSPLKIGAMTIPNRIVMAPHAVGFLPGYGGAVDRVIDYHVERAKGGVGMIVMSNFLFLPSWRRLATWGGEMETSPLGTLDRIDDPALIPDYRRLVSGVHSHGARFISQLNASGRQIHPPGVKNYTIPLYAPSAIPCPRTHEIPRAMEIADIEEYLEAFATSAWNVAEAGGDGVELFAAQGYLLHEFLSPNTNQRTDRYGGDLEGRMRFLMESIAAIRKRVGSGFVIGVRMNAEDRLPGGIDLAAAMEIASRLSATGAVDYLNVSGLTSASYPGWISDMTAPEAQFAAGAGEIRKVAGGLPVCLVSRIPTPNLAESLLLSGQTDMIGLVRPLISDPEWPNKARAGLLDDIRLCTYSNQACLMGIDKGRGVGCVHNTAVGRERQLGIGTMRPAERSRNVAVVGGGPAGMAAARIAHERGHRVTLFEAADRLGGQNLMTAAMRSRRQFAEVTRWQEHMLRKSPVDIRTGVTATAAQLEGFEAIVLATGSQPIRKGRSAFRPGLECIQGADWAGVHTTWDVFRRPEDIGHRVVVIDEDPHLSAAYVAEHLADEGHDVMVVTPYLHAGSALHPDHVPDFYRRLRPKGVDVLANMLVVSVGNDGVRLEDRFDGNGKHLEDVDTVIFGVGQRADRGLFDELAGASVEIHLVGDCNTPRLITDAILDGERAGWML